MFSNKLLIKALNKEQQTSSTPQFNRYNQQDKSTRKDSIIPSQLQLENYMTNPVGQRQEFKKNMYRSVQVKCSQQKLFSQEDQLYYCQSNTQKQPNSNKSQEQPYNRRERIIQEQITQYEAQVDEQTSQYQKLKKQMYTIEGLAVKEINRYKQEVLERDEQIGKLLDVIKVLQQALAQKDNVGKQKKEEGTQTEQDYKDEQIKTLKQAVVRHIRINKQLTKRINPKTNQNRNKNAGNLNSSIERLVSKIQL